MLIEQDDLVKAAAELEPLPTTITRLAQILARPDFDLKDVEEAIAFDQALTPRLLRLANSALASRGHPISNVRDAVMRVGTGPIFSMAMALGVQRRLKRALVQYGLAEGALWSHSVAAALTVETLGTKMRRKVPVESFTAALLHDVGKLVMARFLEPECLRLLQSAAETGGVSRRQSEFEILGVDHGELGALIAQHWQLPERLVKGIQYHHVPAESADPIANVVHVADIVANRVDARRAGRELAANVCPPDPAALESLKLGEPELEELAAAVDERLGEVLERYA